MHVTDRLLLEPPTEADASFNLTEEEHLVRYFQRDDCLLWYSIRLRSNPEILVGGIAISSNEKRTKTVSVSAALSIYPPYQNQGYGREAFSAVLGEVCKIDRVQTVFLRFREWNHLARHLYISMGFKPAGTIRNAFWSPDGKLMGHEQVDMIREEFERLYGEKPEITDSEKEGSVSHEGMKRIA